MAVRQSLGGDGAFLVKILIFGLFLALIVTFSVTLVNGMRPRIARLKFKKTIFAAVILGAFTASFLVAKKCCASWQNGLALSACATAIYALVAGTFYFDRTAMFARKKEEKVATSKRKDFFLACFPAVVIFLLSFGAYCCGYHLSTAFFIWLFGSLIVLAAIAVYSEIKGWKDNQR